MSLYGRLFLWFCGVSIAVMLVSVMVTEQLARMVGPSRPDTTALSQMIIGEYMHRGADGVEHFGRGMRAKGFDLFLFQDGRSIGRQSLPPPLADQQQELIADREIVRHTSNGDTVFGVPVALDSGHRWHVLGFSNRGGDNKPSVWSLLGVQIAITIAAIALVGWFVARGLSAPLRSVQSAVQRIAGGELTARAGEHLATRDDEIGQLARDVDRMAEHIQILMRDRDRLLHDVSHELRAPMARLRLALELARSESPGKPAPHIDQADKEIERLDALVDQVLTIARLDQRADQVQRQPLALASLLRDCAASASVEAAPRGVRIEVAADGAPTISADPELMRRAVDNLLRNAIRYSPEGGVIETGAMRDGQQVAITVADHGPGAAPADLSSLFQPFFRGRNARAGAGYGLGLAIVARVMKLHGGSAEAKNRPEGGLIVVCRLPTAS